MSRSSDKIEEGAVTYVIDYLRNSEILKSGLNLYDKKPAWDGHILICHKDKSYDRILVQVKGKTQQPNNSPKYKISLSYLQSYMRNGGVLNLVVYDIFGDRKLYYNALTPLELKRYISKAQHQKEVSINLFEAPSNINEFEALLIEFHGDCLKQQSFTSPETKLISLEEAIKNGYSINFSSHTKNLLKGFHYLYAKRENQGCLIPIDGGKFQINILKETDYKISVNGKSYDFKIMVIPGIESEEIIVGNLLRFFNSEKNENRKLNIQFKSTKLLEMYKEYEFLVDVIKNSKFEINGHPIFLKDINENDIRIITNRFSDLSIIVEGLSKLDCSLNIDTKNFKEKDFDNLKMICESIVRNKPMYHKNLKELIITSFDKYSLYLIAKKVDKHQYMLFNFFSEENEFEFFYSEDNKKMITSKYSCAFLNPEFTRFINLKYEKILDDYEKYSQWNPKIYERLNNDVLLMLLGFDAMNDKNIFILEWAEKMMQKVIEKNVYKENEWIYKLNYFQILKRKNNTLTNDNIQEIDKIYNLNISDECNWACHILLDEKRLANKIWESFPLDRKKVLKNLPIYNLFQS